MEAIAHNKAFAKKVHVSQSVGRDFAEADKGKTFKKGGTNMATKKRSVNPAMAMMAARAMPTPSIPQAPQAAAPAQPGMKRGGKTVKKAEGGKIEKSTEKRGHFKEKETMGPRGMGSDVEKGSDKLGKFGESKIQKRGHTEDREPKMHNDGLNDIGTAGKKHGGHIKKMAKGGSTSSRGDGIARRGRTNVKYV
jgi:hypothetical protein